MEDFLLSQHFSFLEMTKTDISIFQINNRVFALDCVKPMQLLAYSMLEPVRHHFGQPVMIHRCFSCPDLNKAIGGSPTSQHTKGEAADFHVENIQCEEVLYYIWKQADFPFGQAISETKHINNTPIHWIHASLGFTYRKLERCGNVLKKMGNANYEILAKHIRI